MLFKYVAMSVKCVFILLGPARLWDELLQCLTCDLEKVILKVKHKELHLLEKGKYVIQITINLCLRSSCKLFIQMQTQFKQHSIPYRLSLLSVFTELYLSERVGGGQTQHRHNATQRFHCAWVNKWVWEQYSPRPPKLLCISRRDLLQIMWTGDTESSPYRRQKRWKRGQREEKFCPPTPLTRTQLLTSSWFSWVSKGGCSGEANILPSGPANFWFSETTSGSHQQ